jgi:hypothetical protein
LRAAYSIPTNLSIPAKTETVALFEQGGFFQSDVDVFLKRNHLPSVPVTMLSMGQTGMRICFPGLPGYSAGFGYDNCTGWGSMFGPLFMYYYLANPTSTGTVPAMPRGLNATATTTTVTVKWSPVSTANGYIAIIGTSSFFGVVPLEDDVTRGAQTTLRGLTPNTTYAILLAALDPAGPSPFKRSLLPS